MVIWYSVNLIQKKVLSLEEVGFLFDYEHKNNPWSLFGGEPFRWRHIKVEYIIMSQLVKLLIMGHGTKYKWIICEKDSKKYYYMWYDHIVRILWINFE